MEFKFCWWNTSLSPNRAPNRSPADNVTLASNVIMNLLVSQGVDFLALGEVSDDDIGDVERAINPEMFAIVKSFTRAGRSAFNMIFIVNLTKVDSISLPTDVLLARLGSELKVAKRLDVVVNGIPICVFASHWPMRLFADSTNLRRAMGAALRREIDQITQVNENARFVIMGDFNDEPFDESLVLDLLSTRCPVTAVNRSQLLFNPFWSTLAPAVSLGSRYSHGTNFYGSGVTERWRTFDQILVSANLLNDTSLPLGSIEAGVYYDDALVEAVQSPRSFFDHLPVYANLTEVS